MGRIRMINKNAGVSSGLANGTEQCWLHLRLALSGVRPMAADTTGWGLSNGVFKSRRSADGQTDGRTSPNVRRE